MKKLTIQEEQLRKLVKVALALQSTQAELPESDNLNSATSGVMDVIRIEALNYEKSCSDSLILECINELLPNEEEINFLSSHAEELQNGNKEALESFGFMSERIIKAQNNFLVEYEGYCEDILKGNPRIGEF